MKAAISSLSGLLAAVFCVIGAGCATDIREPTAASAVEGRWSGFESGSSQRMYLWFTGNRFEYFDANANKLGSGTFVLNESVRPRQMDLTFEEMPSPQYEGKTGLAIYECDGDKLTIAGCEPGSNERPANLVDHPGARVFHYTRE
jgi:uncharacterized protein (TIGR03067 family)